MADNETRGTKNGGSVPQLKPCPFCGGEASVRVLEYDDDCRVWGVFCESDLNAEYNHGHCVDNYPTEQAAIEAWNTRAERTCRIEEVPLGIHDDTTADVCSECRVTIERDDYYCPNCGAKVVTE